MALYHDFKYVITRNRPFYFKAKMSLVLQRLISVIAFGMVVAASGQNVRVDTNFNVITDGRVIAVVVQPDDKILIGGFFPVSTESAGQNWLD